MTDFLIYLWDDQGIDYYVEGLKCAARKMDCRIEVQCAKSGCLEHAFRNGPSGVLKAPTCEQHVFTKNDSHQGPLDTTNGLYLVPWRGANVWARFPDCVLLDVLDQRTDSTTDYQRHLKCLSQAGY